MTEVQIEANRVTDAFAAADYQALVDGAAILLRPTAGVIILTDSDRSDFLHRMTTNEINKLKAGQSAVTVLTNPTARIEQVFTVVARPDELWLLPAPDQTVALERHLRPEQAVEQQDLVQAVQELRPERGPYHVHHLVAHHG